MWLVHETHLFKEERKKEKKKANKDKVEQIIVFAQNIRFMLEELCF